MVKSGTLKDLNIMVVDDNELALEAACLSLQAIGVGSISRQSSGVSALEAIDGGDKPNIILLDLNMPVLDGIEVLRLLVPRNYEGGIILFSGEDDRILTTALHIAGAHGLYILGALQKPVATDILKNKLLTYDSSHKLAIKNKLVSVTDKDIEQAIKQRQIVPYFQPKIDIATKSIVAAEVLARWIHPEHGIIPPIAFISIAEEYKLIDGLTWLI